ncbi:MAG TPA: hypothetical protein VJ036_06095 [bacterium]|nr:hypothetical protein [bacterium]
MAIYDHFIVAANTNRLPLENRAEDIRTRKNQLLRALKANNDVIRILVRNFANQNISAKEAGRLYQSIPDLSLAAKDEIREEIFNHLSQQARQKKIVELQKEWQKHTGTDSPSSWSEQMRIPIQWVLHGHGFDTFFVQYSKVERLLENELDEVIDHLANHTSELEILSDRKQVLHRYIKAVAGDYVSLIEQTNSEEVVKDYVYEKMQGNVYGWPRRFNRVTATVKQWIHANYRSSTYPRLINVIESMEPNDMKTFIKELVSRDALVGVRLLAAIQDKG